MKLLECKNAYKAYCSKKISLSSPGTISEEIGKKKQTLAQELQLGLNIKLLLLAFIKIEFSK